MKLYPSLFAILIISLLFLVNWINGTDKAPAPKIIITDINGNKYNLAKYQGHAILFTFWTTNCPGCIQEMPELIKLHHEFSSQGLIIIAVAMSYDLLKHIKQMYKIKELSYLITWDNKSQITQNFNNVKVTPTNFLIDSSGNIAIRKIGYLNMDLLNKKIHAILTIPI